MNPPENKIDVLNSGNMPRGRLCLMSCDSGDEFSDRIARELDKIYAEAKIGAPFLRPKSREVVFANGEVKTIICNNIRGQDIYIVQCIDDPLQPKRSVNDNLMAVCTAINAAYHSDAGSITAVLPQFPYSRQERKKARESITAQQVARFLEASGAQRVITIDIHSEAIEGFFWRGHLENLHASNTISDFFMANFDHRDLVVVAPDMGSADRARTYAKILDADLAIVDKERNYDEISTIKGMTLVGNVKDRIVFMGDDLLATGGTLLKATQLLKENGADKIFLACTLPFFSGGAIDQFDEAFEQGLFDGFIGTDAVFWGDKFSRNHPWYQEVSVAPLFAHVIHNINQKDSVSELLTKGKTSTEEGSSKNKPATEENLHNA